MAAVQFPYFKTHTLIVDRAKKKKKSKNTPAVRFYFDRFDHTERGLRQVGENIYLENLNAF